MSLVHVAGVDADIKVFLGPISEFIGRQKVLHYSFGCFFRRSEGHLIEI
jgi:hypothetical protein